MKKTFLFILAICITTCPGTSHAGGSAECASSNDCRDGFYCDLINYAGKCVPYPDCTDACSTCTDSNWSHNSELSPGYQSKTTATCNPLTCACIKKITYRCDIGYYGVSSDGKTGCTRCPTDADGLIGFSNAGAILQTECYIVSGTTFANNTGSGIYNGNSYWCAN